MWNERKQSTAKFLLLFCLCHPSSTTVTEQIALTIDRRYLCIFASRLFVWHNSSIKFNPKYISLRVCVCVPKMSVCVENILAFWFRCHHNHNWQHKHICLLVLPIRRMNDFGLYISVYHFCLHFTFSPWHVKNPMDSTFSRHFFVASFAPVLPARRANERLKSDSAGDQWQLREIDENAMNEFLKTISHINKWCVGWIPMKWFIRRWLICSIKANVIHVDKSGSGKDQRQINFRINWKRFFTRLSVGAASIETVCDEVSDMHDTNQALWMVKRQARRSTHAHGRTLKLNAKCH